MTTTTPTYYTIHQRMLRTCPKSGMCCYCRNEHPRFGMTDWALIPGRGRLYPKRQGDEPSIMASDDPRDYIELCKSCHRLLDLGKLEL